MQIQRLLTGAAVIAVAVAFANEVRTDYDRKADFTRYRTYSWIGVQAGNTLWVDRIRGQVDSELAGKGWTRVASDGDAGVAAFGKVTEHDTLQTFYSGFPGWGWSGWGGTATTTVTPERVGTLMVDIFDGQTKKLVWRGVAMDTLSDKPEKNENKLKDGVKDMFKKFPPKAKD